MRWVIEKGPFEEVDYKFERYCDVTYVKYRPFDTETPFETLFKRRGELDKNDSSYIFYGSINLGRQLIRQGYKWQNWLPDKVFDCNYWMPRFGYDCLNYDHVLVPFGSLSSYLCCCNGPHGFIRPNSGYKLFTGHVLENGTTEQLKILRDQFNIFPEDLILCTDVKRIRSEYRLLIGSSIEDQKQYVITGSRYREKGEFLPSPFIPENVLEFADDILDKADEMSYYPAPVWTLDICVKSDTGCAIMEVGSFSSAGLYESDIQKVVEGVERVVGEYVA